MKTCQLFSALLLSCAFTSGAALAQSPIANANPPGAGEKWAASWTTAPQNTFAGSAALNFAIPNPTTDGANEQTFRMIVKPDLWGNTIRLRFANTFGNQPVTFGRVTIGLQTYGANIRKGTIVPVTFNGGSASVTLPVGQELFSDALTLPFVASPTDPVVQGRKLAISFYVQGKSGRITQHGSSFQTSFLTGSGTGDKTQEENDASYPYTVNSWFFIDAVDVVAPKDTRVLVAFGSSSPDGTSSTFNGNDRFEDDMSRRLHAVYGTHVSVVNEGIGGDTASVPPNPPAPPARGPSVLNRVQRDALGVSGVTDVLLFVGTNDYGTYALPAQNTIDAYKQLGQIIHGAGLKFIGCTLTSTKNDPSANYGTDFGLAQAQLINAFIRNSGGTFDSVADFEAATTGPDGVLLPQYATHSSGNPAPDYLHLGRAGMQAEAFTLDLNFFAGPGF